MFWIGFIAAHMFWIAMIEWRTGLFSDWFKNKYKRK